MHEHGGPALTNFGFHNLGIGFEGGHFRDNGRFEITRRPRNAGYFRTPSVRNVAITPPYMHDGSLERFATWSISTTREEYRTLTNRGFCVRSA